MSIMILDLTSLQKAVDQLDYEQGLVQEELVIWKVFRRDRSTTSHTSNESKAKIVFQSNPQFLAASREVLANLTERCAKA